MSGKNNFDKTNGFARGAGHPESGIPIDHPGRGGQNVHVDEKPYSNHPRGGGAAGAKYISEDEAESDKSEIKGNFKGLGGSTAYEGEPVAHPGRGGQNVHVDEAPYTNHPRGSGKTHEQAPQHPNSRPESLLNMLDLNSEQLAVVQDRINENTQKQDSLER